MDTPFHGSQLSAATRAIQEILKSHLPWERIEKCNGAVCGCWYPQEHTTSLGRTISDWLLNTLEKESNHCWLVVNDTLGVY